MSTWAPGLSQRRVRGRVGGPVSYSELFDAKELEATRTLVTTTFASTLCMVSAVLGLGVEERADAIKNTFVYPEPPIAERSTADLD
jgi:hypothetical protein